MSNQKKRYSSIFSGHKGELINYLLPLGLIFLLNMLYFGMLRSDYSIALKANLIGLPILTVLIFFTHYLLENFFPGRKLDPILILIISLVVLSLINVILFDAFDIAILVDQPSNNFSKTFLITFIWYAVICFLISYVKLKSLKAEELILRLEIEKRRYETEIELLKSQIQPHYFLNTLNNLYYLTLEKSDIAPDMVLKFSELVRYLIYQSKKSKVAILDELNVIQNFLDIEKLRFGNRLKIEFDLAGDINDKKITPLILLPFIESSFKNSTEDKIGDIRIKIYLSVSDQELSFSVQNDNHFPPEEGKSIISNLNGLHSTKKRLDLLFKDGYDLNIINEENVRSIYLKIPVYNDKVPDYR